MHIFLWAQTRPKDSEIDGVGIVAILQKATGPEIVLQKQFRPPINKVVIEVPAGLVDEGETAAESAVRELREETGYVGTVGGQGEWGVGCVMFNGTCKEYPVGDQELMRRVFVTKLTYCCNVKDPGFCNTNLNMVHVNVDMSLPENQNLKPELEENEFIEVFSTPLKGLYAECKRLEKDGYAIDARVGTLAEGIEIAKRWKLFG